MKRGLKLGIGIPMVLIGLFMTLGGVALLVLVGTDGTFELSPQGATSSGNALVLETFDVGTALPSSGSFSATVGVTISGRHGDVFVGIGPATDVARYLRGVPTDRIVEVNWPGGMKTEPDQLGHRTPPPPGDQPFWVAKAQASTAHLTWTVAPGDWTLVIMNANAAAGVAVTASGSLGLPALGPIGVILLVVGLAILIGGVLLTISGAKTPKTSTTTPPRPDDVVRA